MTRLACGAAAGTTGQTVAYPLDVVRRRLQVHASAPSLHSHHSLQLHCHQVNAGHAVRLACCYVLLSALYDQQVSAVC